MSNDEDNKVPSLPTSNMTTAESPISPLVEVMSRDTLLLLKDREARDEVIRRERLYKELIEKRTAEGLKMPRQKRAKKTTEPEEK